MLIIKWKIIVLLSLTRKKAAYLSTDCLKAAVASHGWKSSGTSSGPLSWLSSSRKVADQMKTINLNRRFDGSSAIVPSPQTANI